MYDLKQLKAYVEKPARVCIYGDWGVGKTTFVCGAESPLIINLEDNLPEAYHHISSVTPKDYRGVMDILEALYTQDHAFKSVIIDSIDVLEEYITVKICADNGWADITKGPYHKGYEVRSATWKNMTAGLDLLREKGMTIILVAHEAVKKMADPLLPEYDKQSLHIYKDDAQKILDWCDVVGYARITSYVTVDGKRNLATSAGEHVVLCHTNPAYAAKTRYANMPEEIPMIWSELAKYLPSGKTPEKVQTMNTEPETQTQTEEDN